VKKVEYHLHKGGG